MGKIIPCGEPKEFDSISDYSLDVLEQYGVHKSVIEAFKDYLGGKALLRPPQAECIMKKPFFTSEQNFIIGSPTNSGKTLLAQILMFNHTVSKAERTVFVTPLKAIAEEKVREFEELARLVEKHGGPKTSIKILTGDYEIRRDTFGKPPGKVKRNYEVIVITPERLDSIARNPDKAYQDWLDTLGIVAIDEIHLLDQLHRGPRLEGLISRLMRRKNIRVIGLSGTLRPDETVFKWMSCDEDSTYWTDWRMPKIRKYIYVCDKGETLKDATLDLAEKFLKEDQKNRVLIFVEGRKDTLEMAEEIAKRIKKEEILENYRPELKDGLETISDKIAKFGYTRLVRSIRNGCSAYHAGIHPEVRSMIQQAFRKGDVLVVITTTALELGVNFPATHAIIKDVHPRWLRGKKHLPIRRLLQMAERAGRTLWRSGKPIDIEAKAYILLSHEKASEAERLRDKITGREIEPIIPKLFPRLEERWSRWRKREEEKIEITNQLLAEICLRWEKGTTEEELQRDFVLNCPSARRNRQPIQNLLRKLEKNYMMIEKTDERYFSTLLGKLTNIFYITPITGFGIWNYVNDLSREDLVGGPYTASYMDCLFTVCSMPEVHNYRNQAFWKNVEQAMDDVEKWTSEIGTYPSTWILAVDEDLPVEILGSLHAKVEGTDSKKSALCYICESMRLALALYVYIFGKEPDEIEETYGLEMGDFFGLRSATEWLLNSASIILKKMVRIQKEMPASQKNRIEKAAERFNALQIMLHCGSTLYTLYLTPYVGGYVVRRLVKAGFTSTDDFKGLDSQMIREECLKRGYHIRKSTARKIRRALDVITP